MGSWRSCLLEMEATEQMRTEVWSQRRIKFGVRGLLPLIGTQPPVCVRCVCAMVRPLYTWVAGFSWVKHTLYTPVSTHVFTLDPFLERI